MAVYNPCLTCGACCACFRVSFYWAESDLAIPDGVPHHLAEHLQSHYLAMKGTGSRTPRCIALLGTIGKGVHCAIYLKRASVCRNFAPSWENGTVNEWCDKARLIWGLQPLDPTCWTRPDKKEILRAA